MSDKKERWQQSEAQITSGLERKTRAALKEQERMFAAEHQDTGSMELLGYVRAKAETLGRSPHAAELTGGTYIAGRFGGWDNVLKAAGLPPTAGNPPELKKTGLFKKEFQRQARLRRARLAEAREQRRTDHQARSRAAEEERKRLAARPAELAWVAAHEGDTDEELLAYLCQCARNLGHTPAMREVLGGGYISSRFGNWSVAVYMAGLPFRRGMKRPKQKAIDVYRRSHPPVA